VTGTTEAFQTAVFERLVADADLSALVGSNIFDRGKAEVVPCVTFGSSDFSPADLSCVSATDEALQVDIWTEDSGQLLETRKITTAVFNALHGQSLSADGFAFSAVRVALVRVFRDPDGITGHGVVQLEATASAA